MLGASAAHVAFSADSSLVLGVGNAGDGTRVAHARTASRSGRCPGSAARRAAPSTLEFANSGAFSPDGTLVALAGSDGIVRVWELASGKQVGTLDAGWANSLAFAPRGGLLAAMTWDGDVTVARVPGSIPLRTGWQPNAGCGGARPVASPDGPLRRDGRAAAARRLWRPDGSLVQVLRPPAKSRTGIDAGELAFGGDGTRVAVSASDRDGCGLLSAQRSLRRGGLAHRPERADSPLWPSGVPEGGLELAAGRLARGDGRAAWRTASGKRHAARSTGSSP